MPSPLCTNLSYSLLFACLVLQPSSNAFWLGASHVGYVASYLDDMIIHCNTWVEHMQQVAAVLESLLQFGVTTNPKKCAERGVVSGLPLLQQASAHYNLPTDEDQREVHQFLGLAVYYGEVYPKLRRPLWPTQKGVSHLVQWADWFQMAFERVKHPNLLSPCYLADQCFKRRPSGHLCLIGCVGSTAHCSIFSLLIYLFTSAGKCQNVNPL